MLGILRRSVLRKRRRLRIPPYYPAPHDNFHRYPWRPEELALLGKVPDRALAEQLDLSQATVTNKRLELDIPAFRPAAPRVRWTAAKLSRLGKATDTQVAAELGISTGRVSRKREELGIPASVDSREIVRDDDLLEILQLPTSEACRRSGLSRDAIRRLRRLLGLHVRGKRPRRDRGVPARGRWSPEEIQLLGTAPDREVGRRIGRSASAVFAKRSSLGIPSWRKARRSRPIEVELLGKLPDSEIAARSRRSEETVKALREALGIRGFRTHTRWRPEEVALLGTSSDDKIAERLGRTASSVSNKRWSLGIPNPGRRRRWRREDLALLGTFPEAEVARRLGRSPLAVALQRRSLGIPAVPGSRGTAKSPSSSASLRTRRRPH